MAAPLDDATDAAAIPRLSPAACASFARAELDAFLALLGQLDPGDWDRPTPCTLWSVRDVVAHQAGHVQMGSGLRGFFAQANPFALRPYRKRGANIVDAINQAQVDRRRALPIEDVIAELREGTPRSIASRRRMRWPFRQLPVPVAPVGLMPLGDLLHQIFPRDMWIHRLDIADATGKPFVETAGHDGVMVAQVAADVARYLRRHEPALPAVLRLSGPAGGAWILTGGGRPATIEMDTTDFMRRTSGRIPTDEALKRVATDAPADTARRLLDALQAPY